jgi:hypothetical protein
MTCPQTVVIGLPDGVRIYLAAGRDDAVVTLIPHDEAQAACRAARAVNSNTSQV